MRDVGVSGFDTDPDDLGDIKGDSWEMAAVMGMIGRPGVYSGTLLEYTNGVARFGPVRGVNVKKRLYSDLKTFEDIPLVRVSPGTY